MEDPLKIYNDVIEIASEEFREEDHPRDSDGRFTSNGGGNGGSVPNEVDSDIKKYNIKLNSYDGILSGDTYNFYKKHGDWVKSNFKWNQFNKSWKIKNDSDVKNFFKTMEDSEKQKLYDIVTRDGKNEIEKRVKNGENPKYALNDVVNNMTYKYRSPYITGSRVMGNDEWKSKIRELLSSDSTHTEYDITTKQIRYVNDMARKLFDSYTFTRYNDDVEKLEDSLKKINGDGMSQDELNELISWLKYKTMISSVNEEW